MMLFSGIVLSIVAFGALFREVEWDEEDYDEEEGNFFVDFSSFRFLLN